MLVVHEERKFIMQQWPYAKEPFDTKLFVLRFLKKIWVVLCAALVGAVLIGGGYYLKKVTFGGPTEYEITTSYFIEYNTFRGETEEVVNYTNAVTWESWVDMDWFVDRAWEHALEDGLVPEQYGVEKSDLPDYFYATLLSDLRIPYSTVTTPNKELTLLLNGALQKTFVDFAQERTEMTSISIVDETELTVADKDVRTLRAVLLGAVAGAFIAGFILALVLIWDDSIVVPESMAYRYGVQAVGYLAREQQSLSEEALINVKYLFGEAKENGLVAIGKGLDAQRVQKALPKELFQECRFADRLTETDFEKLRKAGKLLLLVESGVCSGKEIEQVLQRLKLQDCVVAGALLCNADDKLIRGYHFGNRKTEV